MNPLRRLWLLFTFVVVSLTTTACPDLSSTTAVPATEAQNPPAPRPEDVLDHFLCYSVEREYDKAPQVLLWDQFTPKQPKRPKALGVGRRAYFCNPVEKKTERQENKRNHPDTHLTCYYLEGQENAKPPVMVSNQVTEGKLVPFEPQRPYVLCVPTGKGKKEDPKPPAIPKDIDHFKCYFQRPSDTGLSYAVRLLDQFELPTRNFTVVVPLLLCNPVSKVRLKARSHEKKTKREPTPKPPALLNPEAHLVCYRLDPQDKFTKTVRIANQFERNALLTTIQVSMLCVPSSKTLVQQ